MAPNKGIGQPLSLTDDQLEEASQITDLDIAAAIARWRQHAPKKFRTLLDAAPIQDDQDQPDDSEKE